MTILRKLVGCVSAALLVAPGGAAADAGTMAGSASAINGDTLLIGKTHIRLHGIDAPELDQSCIALNETYSCGVQARRVLAEIIGRHPVRCEVRGQQRQNRIFGVCRAGGHNLNGWMVGQGWAMADKKVSRDYAAHEKSARTGRRGMWRGQFVAPWDWRRGQRLDASAMTSPTAAPSKGQ